MKNSILIFLFFSILSTVPSCNCKNEDCVKNYAIQLQFNLTPQIDTFKIGDTIWVSSDFSNEVKELNYNNPIVMDNIDFHSELSFEKISEEPFQNANLKFSTVEEYGNLSLIQLVGASIFSINYLYENNKYKAKFGFVASEKGLYTVLLSSFLSDDSIPLNESSFECEEKIESIEYLLNNGINNNYEFISLSADSLIRTTTKEVYDKFGQYSFFVEE